MTKAERIVGGILAISGGGLVFIIFFINFGPIDLDLIMEFVELLTILAGGVLAIVGGIFLIRDKTAGGILAIIGGIVCVAADLGFEIGPAIRSGTFVFLFLTFTWYEIIIYGLAIAGGITGLATGSELKDK